MARMLLMGKREEILFLLHNVHMIKYSDCGKKWMQQPLSPLHVENERIFHNNVAATQGSRVDHRDFACEWKIYKARRWARRELEGSLGENGCMCMCGWVPSLSTGTIATLFINVILLLTGYIPIQNKKLKKKKRKERCCDTRINKLKWCRLCCFL